MDSIRISDNKLKIMLTAEDARRYALNCENASCAESLTREAFRAILTDVRAESGFDASDEKIYIQMYPSKEGGCELFVTRMGLLIDEEKDGDSVEAGERKKAAKRIPLPRKRSLALLFEELEHLLSLCRRLSTLGYIGESEVWRGEKGDWWLIFSDGEAFFTRDEYRFIHEYGKMFGGSDVQIVLSEHDRCICPQNAVATLAKL
jgi:negative regulator of genetic competence, sporulation and motility